MSFRRMLGLLLLLMLVTPAVRADEAAIPSLPSPPPTTSVTLKELLPLTADNLRGHQLLYDEGWFVVTSSRKAFAFAKEKALTSSAKAVQQVLKDYARRSGAYKTDIKTDVSDAIESGQMLVTTGTALSGEILAGTHQLARAEVAYARENYQRAVAAFVKGNLSLGKRTEAERRELANLPGNYYKNLKSDFSNIRELTDAANDKFADKIEIGWESAFAKASKEFRAEYEHSGEQPNSLMALGPILHGYLKAIYHGLAAPAAKTIVKGGAKTTTDALFLPVADLTMVTGRTIQSVGLTVYYTGKTGVKLVSPTVEGGLLSGLSLLSVSAVPATYVTGGTLGAMNQVAFSTLGPTYAAAEGVTTTTVDTARYVSFLAYDSVKGVTKVVINQASAGVVLGYNALTAIPAHLFTGAIDTVVLLAYDGPRLVIVSATGSVRHGEERAPLGELPVGTVIDLKELQKNPDIEVKVLSEESAVIREVVEKLPEDLRVPSAPVMEKE